MWVLWFQLWLGIGHLRTNSRTGRLIYWLINFETFWFVCILPVLHQVWTLLFSKQTDILTVQYNRLCFHLLQTSCPTRSWSTSPRGVRLRRSQERSSSIRTSLIASPWSHASEWVLLRHVQVLISFLVHFANVCWMLLFQGFLETLDPFPGRDDNEIRDYLYSKSLEIEPRHARQAPRFVSKLTLLRSFIFFSFCLQLEFFFFYFYSHSK